MDGHIHEVELLAWLLERPFQFTFFDNGLEIGPVVGVSRWIVVVQPDGKSVVNKSLVERKIFLEEWEDVCLLLDGDLQICDGGSR